MLVKLLSSNSCDFVNFIKHVTRVFPFSHLFFETVWTRFCCVTALLWHFFVFSLWNVRQSVICIAKLLTRHSQNRECIELRRFCIKSPPLLSVSTQTLYTTPSPSWLQCTLWRAETQVSSGTPALWESPSSGAWLTTSRCTGGPRSAPSAHPWSWTELALSRRSFTTSCRTCCGGSVRTTTRYPKLTSTNFTAGFMSPGNCWNHLLPNQTTFRPSPKKKVPKNRWPQFGCTRRKTRYPMI